MTLWETSLRARVQEFGIPEAEPPIGDAGPNAATTLPDWPMEGLEEDMRPLMAECLSAGRPFALVTLRAAEGGPRPVGTQMLVTDDRAWGFVSGGCVESDVMLHARDALRDGRYRTLAYGRGSPVLDIRLPCGGRIDLLVEPIRPGDPAVASLIEASRRRRAVRYLSDGRHRRCIAPEDEVGTQWLANRLFLPAQRLLVIGGDPFALAIAAAGIQQGWEVTILRPNGPHARPPLNVAYRRDPPAEVLAALAPDAWTAIAVTTHEPELDATSLAAALASKAGYVGALGSRRRLAERLGHLRGMGLSEADLCRLRSPLGLPSAGRSPREIAVGVIAEIIGCSR